MSSIQYDGKVMLTDKDGSKVAVMITTEIINEALHFYPGTYDLLAKTKSIDNKKAFIKAEGNKYKYSDMIYMADALPIRCNYGKFIRENLIEANSKSSAKNKLYTSVEPMLTRIAYQALGMIKNLPTVGSQASLIQHARTLIKREVKGNQSKGPSDEEDTSTPLNTKSKKPRSETQIAYAEAQVRVEARKKELANARVAKAIAKMTNTMTMEEARQARIENAKAMQEEKRRIKEEQKAQEEAIVAQTSQASKEKEVVDLTSHIEHLKKTQRDKNLEEQWSAPLAQKKIKEALKRKVEELVLEPRKVSPKKPRQEEDEENLDNIQVDPIPPSPKSAPLASPCSSKSPIPLVSPTTRPPPSPKTPFAPKSPQQQPTKETSATPTSQAPKATKVPKWASKIKENDVSAQTEATGQQDREQDPRVVLKSHPPGPPQERVQIQLPTREVLEPRAQSPSSAKPIPVPTLIIQIDPSQEEAYEFVRNFDYSQVLQNSARQFQIALQVVTQERDRSVKDNENMLQDLLDIHVQLTKKEAQCHELVKNENKMKEQFKYEDSRYQKLNASYNTIKNTLTALLQNQEPAAAAASTSESAASNALNALQEEL
ncbi:hypothetical protein L7F22_059757 [Adiantum nelumboides]|nr:hypothetical protein [Adiantum nelumboides]